MLPGAFSRRRILGGIAGGTALTIGPASADDGDFSPDVDVSCWGVEIDSAEPATEVRVVTADGTTHGFSGQFESTWFGYRSGASLASEENVFDDWHGFVERATVSDGEETIRVDPELECPDVTVSCSTITVDPDDPAVTDVRFSYDDAFKMYDAPIGSEPVLGSPGRVLRRIDFAAIDASVELAGDCEPDGEQAVTFDCTRVTVEPEEFVNGADQFYNVWLSFADGSEEQIGDRETEHRLPATFEGSGDNEGKVVEQLRIWNDPGGSAMFTYDNPDLDRCLDREDGQSEPSEEDEDGATNDDETDTSNDDEADGDTENSGDGDAGDAGSSNDAGTEDDDGTEDDVGTDDDAGTEDDAGADEDDRDGTASGSGNEDGESDEAGTPDGSTDDATGTTDDATGTSDDARGTNDPTSPDGSSGAGKVVKPVREMLARMLR